MELNTFWGTIPLLAIPFLGGMVIAACLEGVVRSAWRVWVIGLTVVVGHDALILGAPFWGWLTEFPLLLVTTASFGAVMLIIFLYLPKKGESLRPTALLAQPFLLLLMAMVLAPWSIRQAFAEGVAWDCRGKVERKYHSSNHHAPALEVRTARGLVTLEGVDAASWDRAKVGSELWKRRGSVMGRLNGQPIRVVPRVLWWWNEPTQLPEDKAR